MKRAYVLSCAIVAITAGTAVAGPIAVEYRGTAMGKSASVTFASGDSSAFTNRNLFVGQLVHRLGTGASAKDFVTYCIDLTQNVGNGTFNLVNLYQAPVTNPAPSDQWRLTSPQVDALNALFHAHGSSIDTNNKAAAFQAAIWEIVFDWESVDGGTFAGGDTTNLKGGRVSFGGTAISNALFTDYLTSAVARSNTRNILAAIVSPNRQDQVVIIPLPTAGAMAAAGMLVLGTRRRRAAATV